MQKLVSLIVLIFLVACTTNQTVPTKPIPTLVTVSVQPAAVGNYPPPTTESFITTAYPVIQLTAPPTITPLTTSTETPTPVEPTLPPLMPKVQLEALTLYNESTGWALQSFLTPSTAGHYYDVERKVLRTVQGFQGWRDVSPPPFQEKTELRKAFFLDENTAVAIFYRNFMPYQADTELTGVRTTDGGHTWQVGETMHFSCCLRQTVQMEMLDADHGWMFAEDDGAMGTASLSFFRTADGGLHWEKVYDSNDQMQIDSQKTMFAIANPFGNSGFALIDMTTALYATGRLFRSEDGGKNWRQTSIPIPPATSDLETQAGQGKYEPFVATPQFWTKQNGVMIGRYYTELQIPPAIPTGLPVSEFLYYTQDGGKTWTFSQAPARTGSPFFLDSKMGWYLGKNGPDPTKSTQIYQTTDGGQTWAQILSDCPVPLGSEIHFIDAQMGYALMSGSSYDYLFDARAGKMLPHYFFTHDGGHTWEQVELGVTP